MSEPVNDVGISSVEQQPTSLDLANSWLDYRITEVHHKIDRTKSSIHFTSTYEPKISARPSYVEPGSMDASDWNVAEGEYNQWPQEQEEELEHLNSRMDDLEDELGTISGYREQVVQGDTALVKIFSEKEAARRAEIAEKERVMAERKRLEEEKVQGKEMEGVVEVEAQLRQVIELAQAKQLPQYKKGEKEWQFGWHNLKDQWNSRDLFDFDRGDHEVMMRIRSDEGEGISVHIDDFRNPQPSPEGQKYKYPADVGESMQFTVKEGKVYQWSKGQTERSWRWGYPEYQGKSSETSFEQTDFNHTREFLGELASDMKALVSQPNVE